MENRQNIQKQIRENFELTYKQRLLTMKNFYQMRYQTLQQTMINSYKKVIQDQILSTMIRDSTTMNYIQDRVKQLFKEIIQNQREVLIEKVGLQYSELKFHYQELERKWNNYRKESQMSSQKLQKEKLNCQNERVSILENVHKKDQQLLQSKLQLKQKILLIKQKQKVVNELQQKLNEMGKENMGLKIELKKINEDISEIFGVQKNKYELKQFDLKQSQRKLTLLQNTMKQMEKINQQKIQMVQKKYRKKIGQYKNKIQQYKKKISQIINQKYNNNENDQNRDIKLQQLQKKIVIITRQHQKKMNQFKNIKDKDKLQMEKKYQIKYKQLQNYYQKLLQDKIQQSEKIAYDAAERIKQEQDQIRKYIQYMEDNSTPSQQYNKLAQYCQGLKQLLQNKIVQGQKVANSLLFENKQLQTSVQQGEKLHSQLTDKCSELQQQLTDTKTALKQYAQQLSSTKTSQQKLRLSLSQIQQKLSQKQQQTLNLKTQQNKLKNDNICNINTINEKQKILLQKLQDIQYLNKKINKFNKDCQILNQQLFTTETSLNNYKKSISQKQNKIIYITQQNQFKIDNLNSQLHNSNINLQSNIQKLRELSQKYNKIENQLTQQYKHKTDMQTLIRKLQLQNKYVKQSQDSYRQQHQNYLNDFKKKINQKNDSIQQLQNNIMEIKKLRIQQNKQNQIKYRKLIMSVKKISRVYSTEVNNLSRSLKDIKIYLQSGKKLLSNELKLIQSSMIQKIRSQYYILITQKNEQYKQLKQITQQQKYQFINIEKIKLEKLQNNIKQKYYNQIKNYQISIAQKNKQIQEFQKIKKGLMCQKNQLLENFKIMEKKYKEFQFILQNQKIQNKSKICQLIQTFDTQKDKIVTEYATKRDKQQQQMDQLLKNMKSMRRQLQSTKTQHQQLKSKWLSQSNSLNSKERSIEIQLQKKKIQLQNSNKILKQYKQNINKYDNQMKLTNQDNRILSNKLAQLQFKNQQIIGQLLINKTKIQRLQQQNQDMKRQLTQKHLQKQNLEQSKKKVQYQLKQIKININKSNKGHQLRALQQLDIETKQLSSKVNQLKKVNLLMSQQRTPLRS